MYLLDKPLSVFVINQTVIEHTHHLMHPQSEKYYKVQSKVTFNIIG